MVIGDRSGAAQPHCFAGCNPEFRRVYRRCSGADLYRLYRTDLVVRAGLVDRRRHCFPWGDVVSIPSSTANSRNGLSERMHAARVIFYCKDLGCYSIINRSRLDNYLPKLIIRVVDFICAQTKVEPMVINDSCNI